MTVKEFMDSHTFKTSSGFGCFAIHRNPESCIALFMQNSDGLRRIDDQSNYETKILFQKTILEATEVTADWIKLIIV